MPIYNKDGTPYKIQGINPLMKDQELWKDWQVHCNKFEEIIINDPTRQKTEFVDENTPSIAGVGYITQTDILYCLPVIIQIEEDPLYGQSQKKVSYGEKFSFEAILINSTGITATFFARISPIEQGSILFVFNERQWWKVNGTEVSEDGINIYCVPSELKPSFI